MHAHAEKVAARPFPTRRARDDRRRAADHMVDVLVEAGVTAVFGIPGGSIAPMYDALMDRSEIRVVTTRHEGHAVFAAAAYAQLTGRVGVVLVTSGPGVLNTVNGLGSALTDSLPVVVIAGEAAREGFGRGAVQEGSSYGLNVVAMTSHVTKLALELTESRTAPTTLKRAIDTAMSGRRGPVLLSAPLNILSGSIARTRVETEVRTEFKLGSQSLRAATLALRSQERKVILAGAGARFGRAPELLRQLAEQIGCPVMTTPKGKGVFPESHPLALGVFGMGGHPSTSDYLEGGVDVVLVVGSSLNEVATNGWSESLAASRTLIHIDIDAQAIGRTYHADVPLVAPAEVALRALMGQLGHGRPGSWSAGGVVRAHDAETLEGVSGRLTAPRALAELQRGVPEDAIYTTDSGSNLFFAIHYLEIDRPESFISLLGLGSMGSGLPAALGAQLGAPDRTVVSVLGDGGLSMVAGELSTFSSLGLPVVVAVLNDGCYGMVEFGMKAIFGRAPTFDMTPFDVAAVAAGCGAEVAVAEAPGDVAAALRAWSGRGPLVLDIRIEPHTGLPTNKRFQQITKNTQAGVN